MFERKERWQFHQVRQLEFTGGLDCREVHCCSTLCASAIGYWFQRRISKMYHRGWRQMYYIDQRYFPIHPPLNLSRKSSLTSGYTQPSPTTGWVAPARQLCIACIHLHFGGMIQNSLKPQFKVCAKYSDATL